MPNVLIIIVTWNKKQYVLDLLDSVKTLDYPEQDIDIVVIDNASNDGTAELIRAEYSHVHLICNPENIGGTGGFNTGLKWAFEQPEGKYQYLWLLDNDVLVHQKALTELVDLLEQKPDIAVAGSTMMQLDYPWRINEMGAYVDRRFHAGQLILNRHMEQIPAWFGKTADELLTADVDLSKLLMHCNQFMDIEYVAAASLVIRADVAKKAGLWRDYFIHYDDIEWCLRIGKMGHRVVVSAKSLIWHLSAAAKVPTWVLYYDNRNVLDMLQHHGLPKATLQRLKKHVLKKAVYYHLIGKSDLAQLHDDAINDFDQKTMGKCNIQLQIKPCPHDEIKQILLQPEIKRVLISYPVNLNTMNIQEPFRQAQLERPELQIEFMPLPTGEAVYQLPNPQFISNIPRRFLARWWRYWTMRGQYDLVVQSDYQPVIGLAWMKAKQLYVNDENFCVRETTSWKNVWQAGLKWFFYR
ncbi:glycosyltransferase family 2 protein [Candidatus Albibeggiatoa sp. nov. BB20]|uniref:glycosyltransferase family 2 protein n=1 Tax=Candidatus Albibeggiatoa sp. nov. BB20 TaxID=3162723 RepID=UPI003365AF35